MLPTIKLPVFDIRNFTDRLQPSKQCHKYICPICGGDDLGIDPKPKADHPPAYKCFSNECDERDIREALRPLKDAIAAARQQGTSELERSLRNAARNQIQSPQPTPLPAAVLLAKLPESVDSSPPPSQRTSLRHGEERVWQFDYSPTQWVERIQWADASKSKGYDKTYLQWHLAIEGEEVPLWENGTKVGTRPAEAGEAVCSKGSAVWSPYRFDEAVQAAQTSGANFFMGCEGELAVEQYRQLGIACITLQGSNWSEEAAIEVALRCQIVGLGLVYQPDHDKAGYKKAQTLQHAFDQVGVPFLELVPTNIDSDVPNKGDVVDMVRAMGESEFIQKLEIELHRAYQQRLEPQTRPDQPTRRGQTPAEIAAEIAEDYRDRLAWNDEAGLWYRYEAEFPGVWSLEGDTAIGAVVMTEFETRLGLSYKASWIEECIKILKWKLIVKKWEQPSDLIPFCNGVLHTQSGEFSAHAPGYRFTWALPRDHNSMATDWGTIKEWMNVATGGSAKIKTILLCWLNACLKGRSDLQRFLHLTGAGGTGKGTFIRLAISLVGGENNHASSLLDWCGNRFEPVNAYKKRLLSFADEDKYTGGLSNFKKVTGGDAIRGEVKKKQAFDFTFEGMVMLASNYPIFSSDTSSGIYRRLLMVPFNHTIPPNQRRHLDSNFEPELAALTNYVLAIPDEVVSQTLRQSINQAPEVIERTWDWRMRQDSVAAWLNESVLHDPYSCERVGNDKEDVETLFGSYYRYCEQTGSRPKGSREFSPALLELVNNDPALNWGLEKKRVAGGFMIHGLRLRKAGDLEQPYCLEALADVGSRRSVESDVGWDVESKPLLGESYVGCVGSEALLEKNAVPAPSETPIVPSSENLPGSDRSPYTPCTNETQSVVDTLHSDPTVQDSPPTLVAPLVQLLTNELLTRIVQSMAAISSVGTFEEFQDKYDRLTNAQQRQVWSAARPEAQQIYQRWQDAFLAVSPIIWEARKALLSTVTVTEINQIRQQFDQDVLTAAFKLIHPSSQRLLKRILEAAKRVQP